MDFLYSILIALIATVFLSISSLAMVETSRRVIVVITIASFCVFFILSYFFTFSDILLSVM